MKIHGYYYLPEGKKLFLDISDILNKRHSTGSIKNLDTIIADIFNRYQSILLKDPPFNIEDNIPHIDNLEALNFIKSKLNVGNVTIEKSRNRCSFVVQDFTEIKDMSYFYTIFITY